MNMPVLLVDVTSIDVESNIDVYRDKIDDLLNEINMELNTDEDFIQAKENVKLCSTIETKIADCKSKVLEQCDQIYKIINVLNELDGKSTAKRLTISKLCKTREQEIKDGTMKAFREKARLMVESIAINMPYELTYPVFDFGDRLKGLKTIKTFNERCAEAYDAYEQTLTDFVSKMSLRSKFFNDAIVGFEFLFPDAASLIQTYEINVIDQICRARISGHESKAVVSKPTIEPVVIQETVDVETGEIATFFSPKLNPVVLNPPDKIYLCYGDLQENLDHDFASYIEWSETRFDASDVCYTRLIDNNNPAHRDRWAIDG